jgi:hypothetical protein
MLCNYGCNQEGKFQLKNGKWENKRTNYIPDFYLIVTDEYIETKGYETEKDLAKWEAFPHKLTVLLRRDLRNLGLKVI